MGVINNTRMITGKFGVIFSLFPYHFDVLFMLHYALSSSIKLPYKSILFECRVLFNVYWMFVVVCLDNKSESCNLGENAPVLGQMGAKLRNF